MACMRGLKREVARAGEGAGWDGDARCVCVREGMWSLNMVFGAAVVLMQSEVWEDHHVWFPKQA